MIEKHYLDLLTWDGFIKRYQIFLAEFANEKTQCEKAYEATERMHLAAFGKTKYTNYDSFRVMLSSNKRKRTRVK